MRLQHLAYFVFLSISIITAASCKKLVEVGTPENQIPSSDVFTSDASALSAISGIYSKLSLPDFGIGTGAITLFTGLSADELIDHSGSQYRRNFYLNNLDPANILVTQMWSEAFNIIYAANVIIEGLENTTLVSDATSRQIKGEALFIRAFLHFYLAGLSGDVPYVTTTDYRKNGLAARTSVAEVYNQIAADLVTAKDLLSDTYPTDGRMRPNRYAAAALLARVHLYKGDWLSAELESTLVLENASQYALEDLNSVFLKNSREAIWQLMPVRLNYNATEATYFILEGYPSIASLTPQLFGAFDSADQRLDVWTGTFVANSDTFHYPYKYKTKMSSPANEYYVVLRVAEQFLIRAEARAMQDNLAGAEEDINVVRTRAGLAPVSLTTHEQSQAELQSQRRAELFAEWGHRWLDLKRWNIIDDVLAPVKGAGWQSHDRLYPIPQAQIANNPNFAQNEGY